jgi:hypothetical protein
VTGEGFFQEGILVDFFFGRNVFDGYEIIPVIPDGAGNNPRSEKKILPRKKIVRKITPSTPSPPIPQGTPG